jgi:flagellar hook-associated protein 1 FlgK
VSITSIFLAGQAGLTTAQTQIRVAGDNIANINTPGYSRKIANQESVVVAGQGLGARIASVTRAADRFLQGASLTAGSRAGQTGVMAEVLDQAQSLFGDPSEASSFFSGLDDIYAAFSTASESPSSSLGRGGAIVAINDFLSDATRISKSIQDLRAETDRRITSSVGRINEILQQISQTNVDISRSSVVGGDASGSENIQAKLLDELSGLMAVQVTPRSSGGVTVRSADGSLLAGDGGASTIAYTKVNDTGVLTATPPKGTATTVIAGGGQIDGLLQLGKTELPHLAEQLSEFVSQAVDELNRVHNANTSVPAPTSMTGRDTGLDIDTAFSGFTGKTSVAITNPAGVVQKQMDIDFGAGTVSVGGVVQANFTDGTTFVAALNGQMPAGGSVTFGNGRLQMATGTTNGIVISDDPTAPSDKVGKGFSHFFGMNDLITSTGYPEYETGLQGTDANGFLAGGVLQLQLTDASGNVLRGVNVTMPGAGDMNALLTTMNNGVAPFGSFGLDTSGRMTFTPSGSTGVQVSVIGDSTHRGGASGPSVSELFGIGSANKVGRTESFEIRQDISVNYNHLAMAQFDRTATAGQPAIATGDGRGALALAKAGSAVTSFGAAGDMRAVQMSVLAYASELSGTIGSKASSAADRKESADAVATEANTRRASVEGVNLDEELVNLTTYQQAYNASARLIQAAKDLYDILLSTVD